MFGFFRVIALIDYFWFYALCLLTSKEVMARKRINYAKCLWEEMKNVNSTTAQRTVFFSDKLFQGVPETAF